MLGARPGTSGMARMAHIRCSIEKESLVFEWCFSPPYQSVPHLNAFKTDTSCHFVRGAKVWFLPSRHIPEGCMFGLAVLRWCGAKYGVSSRDIDPEVDALHFDGILISNERKHSVNDDAVDHHSRSEGNTTARWCSVWYGLLHPATSFWEIKLCLYLFFPILLQICLEKSQWNVLKFPKFHTKQQPRNEFHRFAYFPPPLKERIEW